MSDPNERLLTNTEASQRNKHVSWADVTTPIDHSSKKSMRSTRNLSARHLSNVNDEMETEQEMDKTSIFLMIFINFLSNVVFSIVLPSLPTFIGKLVLKGGYLTGWAVAANSFGTFIASPIFGFWADKRNFREVMGVSLVIMVSGNIWYAIAGDIYSLLAARFIVGVAAANYAPAGAYLSYASSKKERTTVMSLYSASTILGFICGPSFSLLTALPIFQFSFKIGMYTFEFTDYTASGWVSALFALIGLLCIIGFKEVERTPEKKKIAKASASMRSFRSLTQVSKTSIPMSAVIGCLFLTFCYTTSFTIFETTGPLYTSTDPELKWNVLQNSEMFLAISGISLASLVILQALLYLFPDFPLMMFFSMVLTAGIATFFDWNFGFVSLIRLWIAVAMVAMGYSICTALLNSIFTKLLDESEQGIMMGWLSSAAAIARMVCPPVAAYVFHYLGPNLMFLGVACLVFIGAMTMLIIYCATKKEMDNRLIKV